MSRQALQSLEYDCKEGRSARQLIGYNGAEIPVTESFHNLLQTVDVELNCEVCVTGTSEIQNLFLLHSPSTRWTTNTSGDSEAQLSQHPLWKNSLSHL